MNAHFNHQKKERWIEGGILRSIDNREISAKKRHPGEALEDGSELRSRIAAIAELMLRRGVSYARLGKGPKLWKPRNQKA